MRKILKIVHLRIKKIISRKKLHKLNIDDIEIKEKKAI